MNGLNSSSGPGTAATVAAPPRGLPSPHAPDWSREAKAFWAWDPSRSLLASLRTYQRLRHSARPDHVLRRWLAVLRHRFWSVVTGADVPLVCRIDGGLLMPHPNGIVVHPDARIGPNCLLMQQVTLGTGGPLAGAPVLVGHVDIGAGAKVLGGVTLGAHAQVGANAVVLRDVPTDRTAVGIPARIVEPAAIAPGTQDTAP
ncbi:serine O-acetyltransferase [Rhizobacter fulvus]|jgi:serine O-acetyltransferase